jgi:hypothetical protein
MLPKRMPNVALLLVLMAGAVVVGLTRSASVSGQDTASPVAGQDVAAKIENAASAAPPSITDEATILDNELDAGGKFVLLREGSNGWFCFPDVPTTPGNDPSCNDQTWLDWTYAYVAGEAPNVTVAGLAYMLQGGSDASNTDPFATEPAAGEDWMTSPPHVMILLPGKLDLTVFTTGHHTGGPYVMWAGTPYEHIMMPVAEVGAEHAHVR